ncbi:hypothetical protein FDZ71_00425 [bacterium]|nr:MAG: hypothetical protein FDZ71_00425 [bacterium]
MPQIRCCHKCKPPKRYPGCGDHCDEYRAEKAIWEQARKAPEVAEYIADAKVRYLAKHVRNPYKVRA